jgi:hypothetical protein
MQSILQSMTKYVDGFVSVVEVGRSCASATLSFRPTSLSHGVDAAPFLSVSYPEKLSYAELNAMLCSPLFYLTQLKP